jgi:hypothetical protein
MHILSSRKVDSLEQERLLINPGCAHENIEASRNRGYESRALDHKKQSCVPCSFRSCSFLYKM